MNVTSFSLFLLRTELVSLKEDLEILINQRYNNWASFKTQFMIFCRKFSR